LLSEKQLAHVCLLGEMSYETCRYCMRDSIDYVRFYCVKHSKKYQEKIDRKTYDFFIDCGLKGISPYASSVPLGDNCDGYPLLKTIEQGYDC
jgi:hypothetical protein